MSSRDELASRGSRYAAAAAPVAIVALLALCWPLARVPPLSLVEAWAHLFATWALLIVALVALARVAGRPGAHRDPRRRPGGA